MRKNECSEYKWVYEYGDSGRVEAVRYVVVALPDEQEIGRAFTESQVDLFLELAEALGVACRVKPEYLVLDETPSGLWV